MEFRSKTVRLPAYGGLEFEVLADDAIIGPAIEQGSWADDEVRLMCAHLGRGKRAVDLGANVGWFAVQAVLAGAEVDAFEPVPAIAELARRNVERANAVGPGKGRVHVLAAGRVRSRARIALGVENFGDNRVLGDSGDDDGAERPADMGAAELIEIEIAPVDEILRGPIDFLKVDTQGSEWLALQGCRQLLADSPRLGLLLEFWPYALRGCTPEALLDFLLGAGFTLGKATVAPYPMTRERILHQLEGRDPVRGGIDLYGVRGRPFHVLGGQARLRSLWRGLREPR